MEYNIELCMKVSAKKWVDSLREGTACFNTIDFFIKKAEESGNNEQGDKYEGVFGRIKKDDSRFEELKVKLGDDLEIIDDGDFVILRRRSSRSIPIFCTYGILREEIDIDQNSVRMMDGEYFATARYDFPSKIYNGFLDNSDVWGFYCSAGHLHQEIESALNRNNIKFRKVKIEYDIDLSREFLLSLDDEYSEVMHKRIDLSYQHEIRYYLLDFPQTEKYLLAYTPLPDGSCGIAPKQLYMNLDCKCKLR